MALILLVAKFFVCLCVWLTLPPRQHHCPAWSWGSSSCRGPSCWAGPGPSSSSLLITLNPSFSAFLILRDQSVSSNLTLTAQTWGWRRSCPTAWCRRGRAGCSWYLPRPCERWQWSPESCPSSPWPWSCPRCHSCSRWWNSFLKLLSGLPLFARIGSERVVMTSSQRKLHWLNAFT